MFNRRRFKCPHIKGSWYEAFSMQKILVIHGDEAMLDMLAMSLESADYEVRVADSAESAHELIKQEAPNLILLDWSLPGTTGVELLRGLKRNESTASLPVLLLTEDAGQSVASPGFDAGADGKISTQSAPRELISQVRTVLRRNGHNELTEQVEIDSLVFDPISYRVSIDGQLIDLSPTGFRLLKFFLMNQDRVFTRNQILDHVWHGNVDVDERTVDVHIRHLRKAISVLEHDKYIQTVRGAGYRFSTQGLKR